MNKAGILLLLFIAVTGCAASQGERSSSDFSGERIGVRVPVLRIVYSANTNGRFRPEAG